MGYAMEQYDAPTDQWIPLISLTQEVVVGGISLNVFNGLTEPAGKDGVWFKTEDEISSEIVIARTPFLSGTWYGDDTVPYGQHGMAVVVVGTKLYCLGGGSTSNRPRLRIRDLITGVWATGATIPNPVSPYYADAIGSTIYAIGGGSSNNTRIYDIATDVWSYGSSTSVPAGAYLFGGKVGTKLYAMSGADLSYNYNKHREYNTVTNTWTNRTNIPVAAPGSGCTCGSKCYTFGGVSGSTMYATTCVYDTTTNAWTTETNMADPSSNSCAASIADKVYVFGGYGPTAYNSAFNLIRVYNVGTGVWGRLADMTDGTNNMCACSDGSSKMYVLGDYTRYRVLSLEDSPYPEGTAVILSGKIFGQFGTRTAKLADVIEIFVEDAWIVVGGMLKSYETYLGNGTTWNKIKDAS